MEICFGKKVKIFLKKSFDGLSNDEKNANFISIMLFIQKSLTTKINKIGSIDLNFKIFRQLETPSNVVLKKYSNCFTETNFYGKKSKKHFLKIYFFYRLFF